MNLKVIKKCIEETEKEGIKIIPKGVTGFSGENVIGLLQRLVSNMEKDKSYVEVGVFQGMTLISVALSNKNIECFGIDNFSQFDKDGKNKKIIINRIKNNELDNITLLEIDFEEALSNLRKYIKKPVGLFFIDGPHDYRSQILCLGLIEPYLSDNAIVVVDDSNYLHVRQANKDYSMMSPKYTMIYQAYTSCHPMNKNNGNAPEHRKGWWNGINVFGYNLSETIIKEYPPTNKDKTLYYNEHQIHSEKYAYFAKDLTQILGLTLNFKLISAFKKVVKIFWSIFNGKVKFQGDYLSMNVFSKNIAGSHSVKILSKEKESISYE